MGGGSEVFLRKMTRGEFRERMSSGELRACILPVAAVEQHLEHLAMEHDWRSTIHVAEAVAARLEPEVLVAEGLMVGMSEEHMQHPGTLSLGPGSFLATLSDLINSLVRAGFRNILVLNGHGGNVAVCQAAWPQLLHRFSANLHFLTYWDVLTEADASELLKGGHLIPDHLPGHAQEFETAIALAAFPENVRSTMLARPLDPSVTLATAETGQLLLDRIVPRLVDFVRAMINGSRIAEPPPFFP